MQQAEAMILPELPGRAPGQLARLAAYGRAAYRDAALSGRRRQAAPAPKDR